MGACDHHLRRRGVSVVLLRFLHPPGYHHASSRLVEDQYSERRMGKGHEKGGVLTNAAQVLGRSDTGMSLKNGAGRRLPAGSEACWSFG